MQKKTLIINGSPRVKGDTAYLIEELKKNLEGEVVEISAYRSHISPCLDCRQCLNTGECAIKDDMGILYGDDYDNVVLATPVYYGTVPGPVLSLMSRFQVFRAKRQLNPTQQIMKKKKAGLILIAGGKGNEHMAKHHIRVFFKLLNAHGYEEYSVKSVNTDNLPTAEDETAICDVKKLAKWLEE